MIPHSLAEVNAPLLPAVQHFEQTNNRAMDEAETILAALKRVLENRIGTPEILHAIELSEPTAQATNPPGVTPLAAHLDGAMAKVKVQPNYSELRFAFLMASVCSVAVVLTIVGFGGVILIVNRLLSAEMTEWGLILVPMAALLIGGVVLAVAFRRLFYLGDPPSISK